MLILSLATAAMAQDGSLARQRPNHVGSPQASLESVSLIYRRPTPAPELGLHDLLTVLVRESSETTSEGEIENRKTERLSASLQDWIQLDRGRLRPDNQGGGDPTVATNLSSQFKGEADLETRNELIFRIQARVVDVRPNGNLVIEARKRMTINEEVWELALQGIISRQDIDENNTIRSEQIADMEIIKREVGHVRDGYRRGWLGRIHDKIKLF